MHLASHPPPSKPPAIRLTAVPCQLQGSRRRTSYSLGHNFSFESSEPAFLLWSTSGFLPTCVLTLKTLRRSNTSQ